MKWIIHVIIVFLPLLGYTQYLEKSQFESEIDTFSGFSIEKITEYNSVHKGVEELKNDIKNVHFLNSEFIPHITNTILLTDASSDGITLNTQLRSDYFEALSLEEEQLTPQFTMFPTISLGYQALSDLTFLLTAVGGFQNTTSQGRNTYNTTIGFLAEMQWDVSSNLNTTTNIWYENIDNAFVYIDDGAFGGSGEISERTGIDLALSYTLNPWASINSTISYGQSLVNNLKELVVEGGISITDQKRLAVELGYRYYDSFSSEFLATDANLNYQFKNINFNISLENIFQGLWNDPQIAGITRVTDSLEPLGEIYYEPNQPFLIETGITYSF